MNIIDVASTIMNGIFKKFEIVLAISVFPEPHIASIKTSLLSILGSTRTVNLNNSFAFFQCWKCYVYAL